MKAHSLMLVLAFSMLSATSYAEADAAAKESADDEAEHSRNAAYVELGGPGIFYSLNYERFFGDSWSVRWGLSGVSFVEDGTSDAMTVFVVPITGQYLFFEGSHHLELGGGIHTGFVHSDLNEFDESELFGLITIVGSIGYRYQPIDGGLVFRATFSPMYWGERFDILGSAFQLWAGLSAGYAF